MGWRGVKAHAPSPPVSIHTRPRGRVIRPLRKALVLLTQWPPFHGPLPPFLVKRLAPAHPEIALQRRGVGEGRVAITILRIRPPPVVRVPPAQEGAEPLNGELVFLPTMRLVMRSRERLLPSLAGAPGHGDRVRARLTTTSTTPTMVPTLDATHSVPFIV